MRRPHPICCPSRLISSSRTFARTRSPTAPACHDGCSNRSSTAMCACSPTRRAPAFQRPGRPSRSAACAAASQRLGPRFFDVGIYVLVASVRPLRIYAFDRSLVRICEQPFPTSYDEFVARPASFVINHYSPIWTLPFFADALKECEKSAACALRHKLKEHGHDADGMWRRMEGIAAELLAFFCGRMSKRASCASGCAVSTRLSSFASILWLTRRRGQCSQRSTSLRIWCRRTRRMGRGQERAATRSLSHPQRKAAITAGAAAAGSAILSDESVAGIAVTARVGRGGGARWQADGSA